MRCLCNRVFGPINRDHAFFDAGDRERREAYMKRRESNGRATASKNLTQAAEDAYFGEKWPLLYRHLVDLRWDDGTNRTTSTIVLFCEEGFVKVCLNDRAEAAVCFMAALTMEDALNMLEEGLASNGLDWRKSNGKSKRS
jgi:hypothetical protein